MPKVYRIHVVLYEVTVDKDGVEWSSKSLRTEELAGYMDDFTSKEDANTVFDVVTGTKEN